MVCAREGDDLRVRRALREMEDQVEEYLALKEAEARMGGEAEGEAMVEELEAAFRHRASRVRTCRDLLKPLGVALADVRARVGSMGLDGAALLAPFLEERLLPLVARAADGWAAAQEGELASAMALVRQQEGGIGRQIEALEETVRQREDAHAGIAAVQEERDVLRERIALERKERDALEERMALEREASAPLRAELEELRAQVDGKVHEARSALKAEVEAAQAKLQAEVDALRADKDNEVQIGRAHV